MSLCKICLCNDPIKDISQLKLAENVNQSGEYILLFCLGIQVIQESGKNTKLCERCFTKLAEFHQFKSLALKNEATLSSLGLQKYIENDIKSEVLSHTGDDTAYDEPLIDYSELEEAEPLEELSSLKIATRVKDNNVVLEKKNKQAFEVPVMQDLKQELSDNEPLLCKRQSQKIGFSKKEKPNKNIPFSCNVCGKQFKTKYKLQSHLKIHKPEEERAFKCAHCKKKFASKKYLRMHIETHKPKGERRTFDCTLCDKMFLVKKLLEIHIGTHKTKQERQRFECTLCKKKFMREKSLVTHLETHKVKEEQKKFVCAHCNEMFMSKKILETHFIRNHPEELSASFISSKMFQCDLCTKSYRDKKNLLDHVRANHTGCKALCPICNKRFAESYLQDHIRTRHQSESLPYKCDTCDHKFVTKSLLKRHVTIHTGVKPFSCDICDAKFRLKYSVGLHKAQVHEKSRNHVCHICSKGYFTSSLLQRHIRAHSSPVDPVPTGGKLGTIKKEILKTVTCPDCGKPLASEETLKHHRLLHQGQKYHCEVCGLAFATRKYVKNHMKTHTQVKKYFCKFCTAAFVRSGARRRHELEVHISAGEKKPPRKDTRKNRIRKKKVKVKEQVPTLPTVMVIVPEHTQELGPNLPIFPITGPFKTEEGVFR